MYPFKRILFNVMVIIYNMILGGYQLWFIIHLSQQPLFTSQLISSYY